MSWSSGLTRDVKAPEPFSRETYSKYPNWYGEWLADDHLQLRWSVFAMHWSIIGWCASYDKSTLLVQKWFGKPL